jgi:chemotaxis regulatin CheY-phosphate phosphatase CheZ
VSAAQKKVASKAKLRAAPPVTGAPQDHADVTEEQLVRHLCNVTEEHLSESPRSLFKIREELDYMRIGMRDLDSETANAILRILDHVYEVEAHISETVQSLKIEDYDHFRECFARDAFAAREQAALGGVH